MKKAFLLLCAVCCGLFLQSQATGADEAAAPDPVREQATGGNAKAQFKLGNEYFYGTNGRKKNWPLAAYWFRRAADSGLANAQLNYAICLERGLGVEADAAGAVEYYEKAYAQGSVPAGLNLALLLLNESEKNPAADPDRALPILRTLSEKGNAHAKTEWAEYLLKNLKTEDDKTTAFRLLSEAVKSRNAPAKAFRLCADCVYGALGTGKAPSAAEAVRLLKQAAAKNDAESMARLAFFYERGEGVKEDPDLAFALYKKAAAAGLPLAQYKYADGIADGREPGSGLAAALEWYHKAAEAKSPQALHKLGLFALKGIGMDQPDKAKAAEFFSAAARLGYAPGQYNLACMFAEGDGIPQNDEAAFFWFEQAAKRRHPAAMRRIARCHFEGKGCPKNSQTAFEWLKYAADSGDPEAQLLMERLSNRR